MLVLATIRYVAQKGHGQKMVEAMTQNFQKILLKICLKSIHFFLVLLDSFKCHTQFKNHSETYGPLCKRLPDTVKISKQTQNGLY